MQRTTPRYCGSLSLADYPGDMVRLACNRCGRRGQYRKATLLERYGPAIALPDLRLEIAQCERYDHLTGGCGVHYEGLDQAGRLADLDGRSRAWASRMREAAN